MCNRDWGTELDAPAVFGFAETMARYCNHRAGKGWLDGGPGGACRSAGLNILRIGDWNMCRNVEWMLCVIQNIAGVGNGEIIFTLTPAYLEMEHYSDNMYGFTENDIYPLEVCLLSEVCANGGQVFQLQVGETFVCDFDAARWMALGKVLSSITPPEARPG